MKVFIGWSGERSKTVALGLRKWIPDVIQAVVPWMSETDIDAGARWRNELSAQLADTDYGIIVVTPENAREPWIHFEAGALAKSVKNDAHVCPYLVDISEMTQVTGPLAEFQAKKSNKEDTLSLMQGINRAMPEGSRRPEPALIETFERWWSDLERVISNLPAPVTKPPKRTDRELLEEVLDRVRSLDRSSAAAWWPTGVGTAKIFKDLLATWDEEAENKQWGDEERTRRRTREGYLVAALKARADERALARAENKQSGDNEESKTIIDPKPKEPR